jgi:predicted O-linked N-acetylglucosamine transferase (SPINDLY family)
VGAATPIRAGDEAESNDAMPFIDTQRKFADVLARHQLGDLASAEKGYREILRADSRHFDAAYLLGLVLLQSGRSEQAEAQFRRAIKINPNVAAAFHDRGNALLKLDRPAEALEQYDRTIALDPNFADAFNNRGIALLRLTRLEEAVSSFDRAIALNADHAVTHYNRGNALRRLKQYDEALTSYQRAIVLKPHYVEAHNNFANTLLDLHRPDAALATYDKIIALNPLFVEAHCNRANALIELRRLPEALAATDRALALHSDFALAWLARGDALRNLRRHDDSLAAYDRAVALKPDLADARAGRAHTLHSLKRHDEAARGWAKLLQLSPDYEFAKGHLAHQKKMACDWSGLDELNWSIREDVRAGKMSADPFGYQAVSDSAPELKRCAELFVQREFPAAPTPLCRGDRYDHDKIRIGYVSGEFRQQATSILMVELFELHDKHRFELFAFDNGDDDGSDIRRRITAAFDHTVDIADMGDAAAAATVRQNEIDLLINLNGFFGQARTGVFSRRPAPIQINYLGFPGTIGADYIDYIIADPIVIPQQHEDFYTEKIVWLPECYQVNDSKRPVAEMPTRAEVMLPDDGFIFCCFNNSYKIAPEVFDVWMRLLDQVDGSILWLIEDNAAAADNLRREANRRGIEPERLVFAPRVSPAEHLARHRLADLFVDTLPYNAHTTASDALWAGVPLLTCLGSTFPGRVAASLLQAVGLPELITHSLGDYEALALRLAREPGLLSSLKARLAQNRNSSPLFDTKRFARHVEAAYVTMWERHRRGKPPIRFAVPPEANG